MLSENDIERFHDRGFVVGRGVVPPAEIQVLLRELDRWIEESRSHKTNWGAQVNGKTVFDLEAGHTAEHPKLRRVANPADVSEIYRKFIFEGPIPDWATQLIGPNIKFHHCKLNVKMPEMSLRVDFHQDHAFSPHTNDDVVVCLLFLDDMNEENGCLRVVPGSHRERYTHFRGNDFKGSVDPAIFDRLYRVSEPQVGKVGDVCFMHTWAAHASDPNRSSRPRRMFIADYTAADAFPLTENYNLSKYLGHIVRGTPTRIARLKATTVEMPKPLSQTEETFFEQQGQAKAYGG
ncbi:MAG: phytanoyl-CoA dioxygenase family protein [Rhodospirillales bacterium]|nr:phytanoyl-CoA dioxygenase family protein [Rhodospirillales bacterium]